MSCVVMLIFVRGEITHTHTKRRTGRGWGGSVESKREKIKEEIKWGGLRKGQMERERTGGEERMKERQEEMERK